jgi:pimeloyl-ACP methyl ester carboxylesterase
MRERWYELDGLWTHTVSWEPPAPQEAPTVLLVHGLGGNTVSWEAVGGELASRLGRRVVALDLVGFGRTRATDRPSTFDRHSRLLEAALTEVTGPATIVGNSMGGSLGVHVAARRPELVSSLVLVNAAFPRPRANADQLLRTARFAALMAPRVATPIVRARARALGSEALVDATLQAVLADPARLDADLRLRLIAVAEERAAHPEAASAYTQSGGSLFRYLVNGMKRDLGRLDVPTLVIHGRRDRLVPVSFARAVAARRKDWHFVELESCGHAPQLEQPERLVGVVEQWLAGQSSAGSSSTVSR